MHSPGPLCVGLDPPRPSANQGSRDGLHRRLVRSRARQWPRIARFEQSADQLSNVARTGLEEFVEKFVRFWVPVELVCVVPAVEFGEGLAESGGVADSLEGAKAEAPEVFVAGCPSQPAFGCFGRCR